MAKLKGNLMSSSKRGKQPNDHLNLQTRKILEVFHLSYCGWVISKQPKRRSTDVLRAMATYTSGLQYFTLLVWKNDSAF